MANSFRAPGIAAILASALLAGCSQGGPEDGKKADAAPALNVSPSPVAAHSEAVAPVSQAAGTLCAAGEQQVFSCTVRGGKLASVCMTDHGESGAFAQYRFGKPGAPELVWPERPQQGAIEWASTQYSGGGEAQLSFARNDVRYVLYSRVVRTNFAPGEPNDPAITDGVAVLRDGEVISQLPCEESEDMAPVDVSLAEKMLTKANELFTYDIE